jgi:hypothetical protein
MKSTPVTLALDELNRNYQESMRSWRELSKLELGDIIEVHTSHGPQEAQFTRLRQKKFEANINGKPWICDIESYIRLVRKGEKDESYKTLKRGEAFYINEKGKASLFIYQEMQKGKLLGINPVGMIPTTIPIQMYIGKVSDIKCP